MIRITATSRRRPILRRRWTRAEVRSRPMAERLDILTDLLPHTGVAELEDGNRTDNKEDDDGDSRGKAVVDPAATGKRQVVDVADQDVGMAGRGGRPGHGRSAGVEQVDQVEVIEIEDKGGHQQR